MQFPERLAWQGMSGASYTNRDDGTAVSLLLMVGDSGPLIRHPPYICYANRANEQIGEMTKIRVDTTKPASEFNLLVYRRPQSLTNDRFLVAYSMSVGPIWSAQKCLVSSLAARPFFTKYNY